MFNIGASLVITYSIVGFLIIIIVYAPRRHSGRCLVQFVVFNYGVFNVSQDSTVLSRAITRILICRLMSISDSDAFQTHCGGFVSLYRSVERLRAMLCSTATTLHELSASNTPKRARIVPGPLNPKICAGRSEISLSLRTLKGPCTQVVYILSP